MSSKDQTHPDQGDKDRLDDRSEHVPSDRTKDRKANENIRKSQGDDSAIGRTGNRPTFDRDR